MEGRGPKPARSINQYWKQHRSTIIWLSLPGLCLLGALACNLPSRQREGLAFPTSQPRPSQANITFPTSEPDLRDTPTSVPITSPTVLSSSPPAPQFWGLQTATPGTVQAGEWITPEEGSSLPPFTYVTQPGDTLFALAKRFGVEPDQITPDQPVTGFLQAGQELTIPNLLGEAPYSGALLPDNAVIYSPESADFEIDEFISQEGGYLSSYREQVDPGKWETGAQIVQRVALESSVSPKVLLAFLEFRSGWVRGQPRDPSQVDYPIGFYVPDYHGLYLELSLVAKQLNMGYYGWREGSLTNLIFPDYTHLRLSPTLNAGSVALQNLASKFYKHQQDWLNALYGPDSLMAIYTEMFGNPWQEAVSLEPLFPPDLAQPALELPFSPGEAWSLTSGPHISWRTGTPRGALDFSPITGLPPCVIPTVWVTSSAAGLVVRSERSIVAIDLDGDGYEQTGWVLVYMHIAEQGRVPTGTWVETNTPIGHPSCEGGQATGTHTHLARKYNGEWLAADGPLPMVLSGWVAHVGELSYEGTLEKDGQVVSAHPDGSAGSTITR